MAGLASKRYEMNGVSKRWAIAFVAGMFVGIVVLFVLFPLVVLEVIRWPVAVLVIMVTGLCWQWTMMKYLAVLHEVSMWELARASALALGIELAATVVVGMGIVLGGRWVESLLGFPLLMFGFIAMDFQFRSMERYLKKRFGDALPRGVREIPDSGGEGK